MQADFDSKFEPRATGRKSGLQICLPNLQRSDCRETFQSLIDFKLENMLSKRHLNFRNSKTILWNGGNWWKPTKTALFECWPILKFQTKTMAFRSQVWVKKSPRSRTVGRAVRRWRRFWPTQSRNSQSLNSDDQKRFSLKSSLIYRMVNGEIIKIWIFFSDSFARRGIQWRDLRYQSSIDSANHFKWWPLNSIRE